MEKFKISKEEEKLYFKLKNKWRIWCIIVLQNVSICDNLPNEIIREIANKCVLRSSEIHARVMYNNTNINLTREGKIGLVWNPSVSFSYNDSLDHNKSL